MELSSQDECASSHHSSPHSSHHPSHHSSFHSGGAAIHDNRALECVIQPDLLRGVSTSVVLQSFGNALSSTTGSLSTTRLDYRFSEVVDQLDAFISHDWSSWRWGKTAVLLLLYNGKAAWSISMVVAVLMACLQMGPIEILPRPAPLTYRKVAGQDAVIGIGSWSSIMAAIAFWIPLLFWQTICSVLHLPTSKVFLDKYCIDQEDEERKAAAILGLAAFLAKSKHLIVCWTSTYFTRLWTVYELASWLHMGKSPRDITFMPQSQALIILALLAGVSLNNVMFGLLVMFSPNLSQLVPFLVVMPFTGFVGFVMARFMRDLASLPEQLANLSITKCSCFCCTHNHRIPATGEPMLCDRELVYRTIKNWFSSEYGSWEAPCENDVDPLATADKHIRLQLTVQLQESVGAAALPFGLVLFGMTPQLWYVCDILPAMSSLNWQAFILYLIEQTAIAVLAGPAFIGVLSCLLRLGMFTRAVNRTCLDFILAPVLSMTSTIVFLGGLPLLSTSIHSVWPLLTGYFLLALLNAGLYSTCLPK